MFCCACFFFVLGNMFPFLIAPKRHQGQGFRDHSRITAAFDELLCLFTLIPGEMIQSDEHIFQMGWFNHQLDQVDS